ncbi:MAG: FkbM family methyltransferase [Clostridia bacterium]|nr:FkbM family methyltransferase [Clostridia bacterium]
MNIDCKQELWEYLASSQKSVVMYGMGNGADKILHACAEKGVEVSDFFASDGFVRGHTFHGKTVRTWGEIKECYGADNVIVLLSFGTSREDVLENILRIASEAELYAPDVPAFGDGLFDRSFYEDHAKELEAAAELLADGESRRIFWNTVKFKLSGDIRYLLDAESDPAEALRRLVRPQTLESAADLGAYNGDTVRELLSAGEGNLKRIYALEPDARNYKKLSAYAAEEARCAVLPLQVGAWSREETLYFDVSGNRNASFGANRSGTLADRPVKLKEVHADALDHVLDGARVDYIKYDVEGSEREALLGSVETIRHFAPTLMVSLYHRNEDLFALPLLVKELFPAYKGFYLRRWRGIPAWDLNLYVTREICEKD